MKYKKPLSKAQLLNKRYREMHGDRHYESITLAQIRRCVICGRYLPLANFYRNRSRAKGFEYFCKECAVEKARQWRVNNPEQWRGIAYKSFARYPERCFARYRANYLYPERQTCSIVGCEELGERHHSDYEKPDEIVWLCKKHHCLLDNKKVVLATMI